MDVFTKNLMPSIPLHEAADFFISVKTAGWMDAPDEDGNLEGRFASPKDDVLKKILEVTAVKFKKFVAYHVYGETMRALAQHTTGEQFREHSEHERAAAEYYLKRASVLNSGPVNLPDDIKPPPPSTDPTQIIKRMIRVEQESIYAQRELHKAVGAENPMRVKIEEIMTEDQHHLDELWQLLGSDATKKTQTATDTKTASAKMRMSLTQVVDQLMSGQMPEGKAGFFKQASAALRFKLAAGPMGFGEGAAGTQDGAPAMQETPTAQQPQPQAAPSLEQAPTLPANYLGAELAGRVSQQQNEANYYRQRMQQALSENQMLQQQMAETQSSMTQLQQQSQLAGNQMQQVTQEAVAAQDRALTHSMEAARMRMGMQKLREQMLQVASQDPNTVAPGMPGLTPDMTGAPVDVMSSGATQQPGAQPAPGAVPADAGMPAGAGGAEESQPAESKPSQSQTEKAGSVLAQRLGGAALLGGLGAYEGATAGNRIPELESQVADMESSPTPGGFRHAVSLAKAKAQLEIARASKADPRTAALMGGAGGALLGSQLGPAAVGLYNRSKGNIQRLRNI